MDDIKETSGTHTELENAPAIKANVDIHEFEEKEGYIVDTEGTDREDLKLAADGHTILVPQPSNDPHDPLNWSHFRKNLFLLIITATGFLPDYGSATGAVVLFPQSLIWHLTLDYVNHSQAGNVFMLGVGSIFVVTLSAYFGRLPILFGWVLMAFVTAAWCAGATSFKSFMAARILNGFFAIVAEGGGQMYINDVFFFHERARKINVYLTPLLVSPSLGPMLGAFMLTTQPWQIPFWVYFSMTGVCLISVFAFVDETYYDRRLRTDQQPQRKSRIFRLIGVEQWRSRKLRNTLVQTLLRPVQVLSKPTVVISVFYNFLTFSWVVGINNTLAIFLTPLYNFGLKQIGYFFFSPVIGSMLGGIIGHWVHEMIARQYIKRHKGHFEPEARLRAMWVGTPFMVAGLVMIGAALEDHYHYMVVAVGWALFQIGIIIVTVSLNSYNLDCYPEASGEVGAWLTLGRTICGFIISYEQIPWAAKQGTKTTFSIQAGLCVVGLLLMVGLQIFGKRIRTWSGKLNFHTM